MKIVKSIFIIHIIAVFFFPAYSRTLCKFPDITRPVRLAIISGGIIIMEKDKTRLYHFDNNRLLTTFSGYGQGPGEFAYTPNLNACDETINLFNLDKIAFFSPDGQLKNEIRHSMPGINYFIHSGTSFWAGFIQMTSTGEKQFLFYQLSADMKPAREIYLHTFPRDIDGKNRRVIKLFPPPHYSTVS